MNGLRMSRKRKSGPESPESDRIVARNGGQVRPLDPDDPRNLDHPSHDEQWMELARAIGRSIARDQYARDQQQRGNPDDEA